MANPIRQLIRTGMAAALPRRRFMVSGPTSGNGVCLTFDDGPHPEHTPRLLDVLRAHGVKATFFMIGREVEKYPQIVRRVAEEGHAVGGHSFSHAAPGETTARQLAEEVERTERLFEEVIGRRACLFRPPHGKLTGGKMWRLWRAGQGVMLWNVDPKDFACRSPQELAGKLDGRSLRGGDVVLLHDNVPHAIHALPAVIDAARGRGLSFVTAEFWMGRRGSCRGLKDGAVASLELSSRLLAVGGVVHLTECVVH
jgi:peptidoglycan/xylan/chitin deacetylase (PgdA/CDA1 family)